MDPAVRGEHTGVADQHVEASEPFDRAGDDGLDLGEIGHVGEHGLDAVALEPSSPSIVACSDASLTSLSDDVGVRFGGQTAGDRGAERAARTEDGDHPRASGCSFVGSYELVSAVDV